MGMSFIHSEEKEGRSTYQWAGGSGAAWPTRKQSTRTSLVGKSHPRGGSHTPMGRAGAHLQGVRLGIWLSGMPGMQGFRWAQTPIPAVPVPLAFKRSDHTLTKGGSVREGARERELWPYRE